MLGRSVLYGPEYDDDGEGGVERAGLRRKDLALVHPHPLPLSSSAPFPLSNGISNRQRVIPLFPSFDLCQKVIPSDDKSRLRTVKGG